MYFYVTFRMLMLFVSEDVASLAASSSICFVYTTLSTTDDEELSTKPYKIPILPWVTLPIP